MKKRVKRGLILCASLGIFSSDTALAANEWWYTVRVGDTLSQLSERELGSAYGYQAEIVALNGINPHTIYIGQRLLLPEGAIRREQRLRQEAENRQREEARKRAEAEAAARQRQAEVQRQKEAQVTALRQEVEQLQKKLELMTKEVREQCAYADIHQTLSKEKEVLTEAQSVFDVCEELTAQKTQSQRQAACLDQKIQAIAEENERILAIRTHATEKKQGIVELEEELNRLERENQQLSYEIAIQNGEMSFVVQSIEGEIL